MNGTVYLIMWENGLEYEDWHRYPESVALTEESAKAEVKKLGEEYRNKRARYDYLRSMPQSERTADEQNEYNMADCLGYNYRSFRPETDCGYYYNEIKVVE